MCAFTAQPALFGLAPMIPTPISFMATPFPGSWCAAWYLIDSGTTIIGPVSESDKKAVQSALVSPEEPMRATTDEFGNWHTAAERAAFVRDILDRIGDKWSVIVICRLGKGHHRFNELRRASDGITQRMLSSTLRALERDGIVTRTVHPTVP